MFLYLSESLAKMQITAWCFHRLLKPLGSPSSAAAAAKSLQLCPTLCNPIDGSPPGSTVPGILQTRTLEQVAISFSNAWQWKVKVKSLSRVQLFTTSWTAAHQAPPSMGLLLLLLCHFSRVRLCATPQTVAHQAPPSLGPSRQEHWSGLPFPSPMLGDHNSLHGGWRNPWSVLL